ncbi:hypothetical protein [Roseicyclus mahoneyensis]|uniref:hypothetical protein n=1 Tax=Roseicyclus mahoneyensis TaxID=164332 RepID=UPI0011B1DDF2|nr:hypothetical protein [Roseicyclus mahoneyensis]
MIEQLTGWIGYDQYTTPNDLRAKDMFGRTFKASIQRVDRASRLIRGISTDLDFPGISGKRRHPNLDATPSCHFASSPTPLFDL